MSADLTIHDDRVPLRREVDGTLRVGSSGVLLQTVVRAYLQGANPEYIARGMYTTLDMADVYSVIGYYLRHREEVDAYCEELDKDAEEARKRIQAAQGPPRVTREVLEARWKELEACGAVVNCRRDS